MRSTHITRHAAEALLDGVDGEDVSAIQENAAFALERSRLAIDDAALDVAAEGLEIVLTAAELAAMHDFLHDFHDQQAAGRRRRRLGRSALRSLPMPTARRVEGEAA